MTDSATRKKKNHLAGELSPYLLQHADNPVHWYPWSSAAFEKAKQEDKPVFLSIGYATCHWCHVMEQESFQDPEVAHLMNDAFVSIKVDREERPDIDQIYMTVCQMMTGGGGWPLTIIMTPDKRPFFATTYIPKSARFGRQGMMELIPLVMDTWQHKRQEIGHSTERITTALSRANANPGPSETAPEKAVLELAFHQLKSAFDAEYGGFGTGMKFPTPHQLTFLLRYHHRNGNPIALEMVEKTLDAMRQGGIYDHLGFGFHRYATDRAWRVPHFEKMLYDQATLLAAYTEAFQATCKPLYRQTALEIAEYVLRDMTSPDGGFFSAEDADSEGEEGKFYLWKKREIDAVLTGESADLFEDLFEIREEGNFSDPMSQSVGDNVLVMRFPPQEIAIRGGLPEERVQQLLDAARKRLYSIREQRPRPLKDDKILTDWNGLMMAALARAGRALGNPSLIAAAEKNAWFVKNSLTDDAGRLVHRYRNGKSGLPAHLDDYAFVVSGLLDLYEATLDPVHLKEALRLNGLMLEHFADPKGGALFLTADDTETVLVRAKELYDGALPSGNSVAMLNLARLSRITGDVTLAHAAESVAKGFGVDVNNRPINNTMFLVGLDFALGPSIEVVISGMKGRNDTKRMVDATDRQYLPRMVRIFRDDTSPDEIAGAAQSVLNKPMLNQKATAYVCVNHSCSFPTTDLKKMVELIEKGTRSN